MLGLTLITATPLIYHYNVAAQSNASADSCELQTALLNNRSQLLSNLKNSENSKYQLQRKKWSKRIGYASQWVKKDAEESRQRLYEYDEIHKKYMTEIDTQIGKYKDLETSPLDCSEDSKSRLADKLKEVDGRDGKKIVGGQALIEKLKQEESKFFEGSFEKSTDKMIKNMRKEKEKNIAPKEGAIDVAKS